YDRSLLGQLVRRDVLPAAVVFAGVPVQEPAVRAAGGRVGPYGAQHAVSGLVGLAFSEERIEPGRESVVGAGQVEDAARVAVEEHLRGTQVAQAQEVALA